MESYGVSHKGYVRKDNEDAYCIDEGKIGQLSNLFVIADGMGGHRGGAVASKMAVDQVFLSVPEINDSVENTIIDSIRSANHAIFSRSVEDNTFFGMGTTIEVVTISDHEIFIGHVGDSRVYLYSNDELLQLTKDHSYVQELVDAGAITQEEAEVHPSKNRITRALGVDKYVEIDLHKLIRKKDKSVILMCTDGLTNMVHSETIKKIINVDISLKERCNALLDEALNHGGIDNITLILIEIEGRD